MIPDIDVRKDIAECFTAALLSFDRHTQAPQEASDVDSVTESSSLNTDSRVLGIIV